MLLNASYDERYRAVIATAAYFGGNSLLLAANLDEARAHLERETVPLWDGKREVLERCSITAAIVMLGFDDGWEVCRRLHARAEHIPVLWVVPHFDYARALALSFGRLDRCHATEPPDINVVIVWLDGVFAARIRCEARRCAKEHELSGRQSEVLAQRARHQRHISIPELAPEMGLSVSTVRDHCGVIRQRSGRNIHVLAKTVQRHIGGGEPRLEHTMIRRKLKG